MHVPRGKFPDRPVQLVGGPLDGATTNLGAMEFLVPQKTSPKFLSESGPIIPERIGCHQYEYDPNRNQYLYAGVR